MTYYDLYNKDCISGNSYKNKIWIIFDYLNTWKGNGKCVSPNAISVQVEKIRGKIVYQSPFSHIS